ncbi:MAG: response regulator [Spirochaetes bacterium]|nr:response regulator [Spirochaetota bacterium]
MEELGPVIKAARERIPLSLKEAEVKSGISNAYLNQIENGHITRPSPEILRRIGELYGIPYEVLLDKAGHPVPDEALGELAGSGPVSVLIIDDDPYDRELFRTYLENAVDMRFTVLEAESGQEAARIFETETPDCVLLDYRLPGSNGLEVLQWIRKTDAVKDVPVIMMTSQGSETVAVSAIKLGAVNYLIKDGITDERLVRAVKSGLLRKRLVTAVRRRAREGGGHITVPEQAITRSVERILELLERLRSKDGPWRDDPDIIAMHSEIIDLANLLRVTGGDPCGKTGGVEGGNG